jgi:predicted transcriptional regulator
MSKITFRADDDLVKRVEALETSKSEVMREALRSYLDGRGHDAVSSRAGTGDVDAGDRGETLDDLVADRVDALVESRLGALAGPQDVNVTVTLETEGEPARARAEPAETGVTEGEAGDATGVRREPERERQCAQCGEALSSRHVYCPNCGEKATRRIFCECGDELRSDWAYCPGCGRRTPSADVLEG